MLCGYASAGSASQIDGARIPGHPKHRPHCLHHGHHWASSRRCGMDCGSWTSLAGSLPGESSCLWPFHSARSSRRSISPCIKIAVNCGSRSVSGGWPGRRHLFLPLLWQRIGWDILLTARLSASWLPRRPSGRPLISPLYLACFRTLPTSCFSWRSFGYPMTKPVRTLRCRSCWCMPPRWLSSHGAFGWLAALFERSWHRTLPLHSESGC